MEQTLRAVTDTNGNFKLAPVPAGRFFVHIDGRTITNDAQGTWHVRIGGQYVVQHPLKSVDNVHHTLVDAPFVRARIARVPEVCVAEVCDFHADAILPVLLPA